MNQDSKWRDRLASAAQINHETNPLSIKRYGGWRDRTAIAVMVEAPVGTVAAKCQSRPCGQHIGAAAARGTSNRRGEAGVPIEGPSAALTPNPCAASPWSMAPVTHPFRRRPDAAPDQRTQPIPGQAPSGWMWMPKLATCCRQGSRAIIKTCGSRILTIPSHVERDECGCRVVPDGTSTA